MTNQAEVVNRVSEFVRQHHADEPTGHDWWHIYRVHKMAVRLAGEEGADTFVVELAALLHDIADWKFTRGDADAVLTETVTNLLTNLAVDELTITTVIKAIKEVSFKGAGVNTKPGTLEAMVVQDADRLDAIGAIGIARAFAYGGHKDRLIHDPAQQPTIHETFEQYKTSQGTTINHFFEKLLLLKDRLNTRCARELGEERHQLMEKFLSHFFEEWEGIA